MAKDVALSTNWSDATLSPHGLRTGTGAIHVLDHSACPLDHIARLMAFAAGESAGQCGPCMFGVPAVAEQLDRLARGILEAEELWLLRRRLELLPGRGACRFPDGIAGFVASALWAFAPDVEAHLAGRCVASRERSGATR